MRKLIFAASLIALFLFLASLSLPVVTGWLNYAGAKNYAMWTTKWLQADQTFYWQGDTIKKDSLIYTDLKADSARFKNINGSYSNWFYTGHGTYTLPKATASILGGIKIGSGLSIDPGTGIASATATSFPGFGTTPGYALEGRTFGTAANSNTGDLIHNQNASAQGAAQWINGSGRFGGDLITESDLWIKTGGVDAGNAYFGSALSALINYNGTSFTLNKPTIFTSTIQATGAKFTTGAGLNKLWMSDANGVGSWGNLGVEKITYGSAFTFSNDRDVVDKAYVDAVAAGNLPKTPVEVATTGNITLSGEQTIDTYTAVTGDRALVWNQTTISQNGIYIVASGAWSRATDTDTWAELYKAYVAVINGSQAGSSFVCTIPSSGTLETTDVTWVLYNLPTNILAGTGLSKTGSTISLNTATSVALGGIKTGSGITMTDGVASVSTDYAPSSTVSFPGFGTSHIFAAYGDHNHSTIYAPIAASINYIWNQDTAAQSGSLWLTGSIKSSRNYIYINQPDALINHWQTFRNSATNYGSWSFVKSGSDDFAFNYGINTDEPASGTSLTLIYGGGIYTPSADAATYKIAGTSMFLDWLRTGYAGTSGQYLKSQGISTTPVWTDFPASLPASDVYPWAKAATKPSYTYSEVGAEAPLTFSTGLSRTGNTITNTITQYTDALARGAISLTTAGNSGSATYNSTTGVLNIPQYTSSTNLSYTASPSNGIVVSDTGTDATIPAGSITNSSLMLPADKSKLNGIEAGATANRIRANAYPYLTGDVTFQQGSNISLSELGNTITISAPGVGMVYPGSTGIVKYNSTTGTWDTSITDDHANWDKYNQWDGGATGLNAATGRTSLGLGTAAQSAATDFAPSSTVSFPEAPTGGTWYFRGSGAWQALAFSTSQTTTYFRTYVDGGVSKYFDVPLATGSYAGLMSPTQYSNLSDAYSNSRKVSINGDSNAYPLTADQFEQNGVQINLKVQTNPTSGILLPVSATGVYDALALKANLSGATFTGAISGTTATFTGQVSGSEVHRGSSRTLKTDIKKYTGNALDILLNTEIATYKLKADSSFGIGFIAEDTHEWLSGEDQKSHLMGNHLGLVTKAIQEQNEQIKTLQAVAGIGDHSVLMTKAIQEQNDQIKVLQIVVGFLSAFILLLSYFVIKLIRR